MNQGGTDCSLATQPFNQGVPLLDATPEQLAFFDAELVRFVETGAWERSTNNKFVSWLFLVPKAGKNLWRMIFDLRRMDDCYPRKHLKIETLQGVRDLTRQGDYMLSFDLHDGFYALGIAPECCDYFTVNVREQLYRLPVSLPLSPFHFCKLIRF
jgi:hypothetical protein